MKIRTKSFMPNGELRDYFFDTVSYIFYIPPLGKDIYYNPAEDPLMRKIANSEISRYRNKGLPVPVSAYASVSKTSLIYLCNDYNPQLFANAMTYMYFIVRVPDTIMYKNSLGFGEWFMGLRGHEEYFQKLGFETITKLPAIPEYKFLLDDFISRYENIDQVIFDYLEAGLTKKDIIETLGLSVSYDIDTKELGKVYLKTFSEMIKNTPNPVIPRRRD